MYKRLLILGFICFFSLKAVVLYGQVIKTNNAKGSITFSAGSAPASPALQQNVISGEKTLEGIIANPKGSKVASFKFGPKSAAAVPAITVSGNPNSVNTSYGVPSQSSSFTISGTNLSSGITVTPPAGFEVSTDDVTFSNTVTVGGANSTGPFTVYIRLAATTNAGIYSGNIVLSSAGATSVNVAIPNSTVSRAIINFTGTYAKLYGDALADFTLYYNTPGFTFKGSGLYNGNTFYSIHFSFGAGAAATAGVGTYTNAVTLSDFQGANGFLASNYTINYFPFNLVILPAPITITANNVSKPYGIALANVPASTQFTVSGMQNSETVGNVMISYGNGASATAAPGLYKGSVVPSNAAGGTFSPTNYDITYQPGDLTVIAPPPPVITRTSVPSPLQTVYGTPSAITSVQVNGINLTAPITVTPPNGFEISTGNSFSNTITLTPDASGVVAATTINIRLAAVTPVGNYTGNLALNTTGVSATDIPLTGVVTPASLTISAVPATKIYGAILQSGPGSAAFIATGLQNGEAISSVTLTYGSGSAAGDPVGVYNASIMPSVATGGSFNAGNYTITYSGAAVSVVQAPLTITANNVARAVATPNPAFTATYTGFVNNEGPAQLTALPVFSTTAEFASLPGQYPITVSGALSPNYNISYVSGTLTVYTDPQSIKVPNTFTPNGDGINDIWEIKDLQYYSACIVDIYNRYGQQLYHSMGYGQAWDGTYHKQPLPVGTYYYVISLNDGSQVKLSGYVAIVK